MTMKKTSKTHYCNTDHPQRACCWAARKAEFAEMESRMASGETARAQAEHDAQFADATTRALRMED